MRTLVRLTSLLPALTWLVLAAVNPRRSALEGLLHGTMGSPEFQAKTRLGWIVVVAIGVMLATVCAWASYAAREAPRRPVLALSVWLLACLASFAAEDRMAWEIETGNPEDMTSAWPTAALLVLLVAAGIAMTRNPGGTGTPRP